MARAFLVVLDSAGIGGAPDADRFFNGRTPDTGANTLGHIADDCAAALRGPLNLPNLSALGLGHALTLASGHVAPALLSDPAGLWGAATEQSQGKDTPSGHWELAGTPVPWDWTHFPDTRPAFPQDITAAITAAAGTTGILGNCHASGTEIIDELGAEHLRTGWPICYTSVDSVLQIAAHEEQFGLERLLTLCADIAPMLHARRVGRVIARPFTGAPETGFARTPNRRDFAHLPPGPTLCDRVQQAGGTVHAIGKIGDIFSMQGIDTAIKGPDRDLMQALHDHLANAPDHSLTFANFVEFDTNYGHRRDASGYAAHLEWFDTELGVLLPRLRTDDMLVITADHGNDPTWIGTDHTRERVPVLIAGQGAGPLGQLAFTDVAAIIAAHLDAPNPGPGRNVLPQ